jgi:hypothetical protein
MSDIDAELSVMGATRWVQGWYFVSLVQTLGVPWLVLMSILGQPRRAGWDA